MSVSEESAALGKWSHLSRREAQVLEMTSRGLTNGEIATRLNVTTHAVKFHLSSIFRKLGVTNRTEAAVMYLQHLRD